MLCIHKLSSTYFVHCNTDRIRRISIFLQTVGEGVSSGISTRTSGLSRSLIIERQAFRRSARSLNPTLHTHTHTRTHTHTHRGMSRVSITNEIDSSSSGSYRHCQASLRIPIGTKCLADSYSSRNPVSTSSLPAIRPLATRTTDKRRLIPIYIDTFIPIIAISRKISVRSFHRIDAMEHLLTSLKWHSQHGLEPVL